MRNSRAILALLTSLTAPFTLAQAAVKVELFISPAPNAFGSPSFEAWFANAQAYALGLAAPVGAGNGAFRGDYGGGTRPCHEFLVTSFDAFDGIIGGTGEVGQRMHVVYHIYDDAGGTVELEFVRGLRLEAKYDFVADPGTSIGPIDFDSSHTFNPLRRVGYNNSDLGTPITSGNPPVDHIVGTFGQGYWPGGDAADPATDPSGPPAYLSCFADYPSDIGGGHIRFTFGVDYDTTGTGDLVGKSATVQNSNTMLAVRASDVFAPLDPVKVYVDATTAKTLITSLAATLAYDDTKYSFEGIEVAATSPLTGIWSILSVTSSTPGRVDFTAGDASMSPAGFDGPLAGTETVCITLLPKPIACGSTASTFEVLEGADLAYMEIMEGVIRPDRSWRNDPGSGPTLVADHGFRRGNVNNVGVPFELNLSDVVDLANMLFGGLPVIDCLGAMDVNNDMRFNISDFVTLVQGAFNSAQVTIAAPNAPYGLAVEGDGGLIPSELGCNTGQGCP